MMGFGWKSLGQEICRCRHGQCISLSVLSVTNGNAVVPPGLFFFSAPSKLQLPGLLPCFTLVYSFQDYSRVALTLLCNGRVANLA